MRNNKEAAERGTGLAAVPDGMAIPFDGRKFFESFYQANVKGTPQDHMTIGAISEMEARFHYNATENSIIRALAEIVPPPPPGLVGAWTALRLRRGGRHLDVGTGTGHWIDFMRDVFFCDQAVAVELTDEMCAFLRQKYSGGGVSVLQADVSAPGFGSELEPVDYVTAIGVMFHIVEDAAWRRALVHLRNLLRPDGLLLVTDEFGEETRDAQFHATDEFASWREFHAATPTDGRLLVNKRVRSLPDWQHAAAEAGLSVVTVVRTEGDPRITTPENDVLVLRRAPGPHGET